MTGLLARRMIDAGRPKGRPGIPWLEALWEIEFFSGEEKSIFSELAVNKRRVLCTRRFFIEEFANTVSMKLGGLLLRV